MIGALGRLAVPGPDPMPIWRTIVLGVLGSFVGGLGATLLGLSRGGGFLAAVIGAAVLLILYRRVVQNRGITGPGRP